MDKNLFCPFLCPILKKSNKGVVIFRSVALTSGATKYASINPSMTGINTTNKFFSVNDRLSKWKMT